MTIVPRVIGLIGPEGAGKSTAAKILEYSHDYTRLAFATPLKRMLESLGVPSRHLFGTPADKAEPLAILGGKTARHAMQTLGTEWGRQCIGPGFWGDVWESQVGVLPRVVADDVRFPNEAERVRRLGGAIVLVIRNSADMDRVPRHASEDFRAVLPDYIVTNNGTIEQLSAKLDHVLGFGD